MKTKVNINLSSQTFEGHTRMILQIIVTPKSFYTSSTDLTVRGWVYNMEDPTRTFKGHQHSVALMVMNKDICKSWSRDSRVTARVTMPGYQARITFPN